MVTLVFIHMGGFACAEKPLTHLIYLLSNGWHTEVIIRNDEALRQKLPELLGGTDAKYFSFEWGDAGYYPARNPGFQLLAHALLIRSPSLLHVTGIDRAPDEFYASSQVIALRIEEPSLLALTDYISKSFDRRTQPAVALQGRYPHSWFYEAKGHFHAFNNCNTWTANALVEAGINLGSQRPFLAKNLLDLILSSKNEKEHEVFIPTHRPRRFEILYVQKIAP